MSTPSPTFTSTSKACKLTPGAPPILEVVLFELVESFEFRPSNKNVRWQSNPVANPAIKDGEQLATKLPIRISLAK